MTIFEKETHSLSQTINRCPEFLMKISDISDSPRGERCLQNLEALFLGGTLGEFFALWQDDPCQCLRQKGVGKKTILRCLRYLSEASKEHEKQTLVFRARLKKAHQNKENSSEALDRAGAKLGFFRHWWGYYNPLTDERLWMWGAPVVSHEDRPPQ